MTTQRTQVGRELETALGEVLANVRDEVPLPCRIVDHPSTGAAQAHKVQSPKIRGPI